VAGKIICPSFLGGWGRRIKSVFSSCHLAAFAAIMKITKSIHFYCSLMSSLSKKKGFTSTEPSRQPFLVSKV
jgi:hypothetical protein